jgi:hypothetical protein
VAHIKGFLVVSCFVGPYKRVTSNFLFVGPYKKKLGKTRRNSFILTLKNMNEEESFYVNHNK